MRAAGLAPLLLVRRRLAPLVPVLVAATTYGWVATAERAAAGESAAVADGPLAPSRLRTWTGPVLLRTTGYADPREEGGWQAPAVVLASGDGNGEEAPPARGRGLLLRGRGRRPAPGATVAGYLEVRRPRGATTPGSFDDRRFLAGRGLAGRARPAGRHAPTLLLAEPRAGVLLAAARDGLRERLERLLPPRESRLAGAVLLGVRTADSRREAAAFTELGLAHLFAVSGLHVGILAGLLLIIVRTAGGGAGLLAAALAVFAPAYMLITGLPGSVLRAGGMVVAVAVAAAAGRRADPLRAAGLLFWTTAIGEPARALDTGAALSYAAAAGILVTGKLSDGFAWTGSRRRDVLLGGLGVSLSAQWATFPLVAAAFGRINPWSPLANLVAVPVFGVLVGLLAAALVCSAACVWLAEALAGAAWIGLRALAGLVAVAGGAAGDGIGLPPPGPTQVGCWLVGTLVLVRLLRRRGPALLAVPLVLGVTVALCGPGARSLPPTDGPRLVVFDTGQGDASLLVFPDGWSVLVDAGDASRGGAATGPCARTVLPWLARQGVDRLDAVVLTHGHRDHTGGASEVARRLQVGTWYAGGRSGRALETVSGRWWSRTTPSVVLHRWQDWRLVLFDPSYGPDPPAGENDRSLALVLRRNEQAHLVMTGDLERAGEARLLAWGAVPRGVDVWKAGHHGSSTSGSGEMLARMRPRVVLISCGVANRHGHPSHGPYVVGEDTARVLRTDLDGTLAVVWDAAGRPTFGCAGGP